MREVRVARVELGLLEWNSFLKTNSVRNCLSLDRARSLDRVERCPKSQNLFSAPFLKFLESLTKFARVGRAVLLDQVEPISCIQSVHLMLARPNGTARSGRARVERGIFLLNSCF